MRVCELIKAEMKSRGQAQELDIALRSGKTLQAYSPSLDCSFRMTSVILLRHGQIGDRENIFLIGL